MSGGVGSATNIPVVNGGGSDQSVFGKLLEIGGTITDKALNVLDYLDRREYNKDVQELQLAIARDGGTTPNTQVSPNDEETVTNLLAQQLKSQMTTKNVIYGLGALVVGLVAAKAFKII